MKLGYYFLKYAFPCAWNHVEKGEISEEKYKELEKRLLAKGDVGKEELEDVFQSAFRRLKEVAKKLGKDNYWDYEVIKHYFLVEHNTYIDQGEGEYVNATKTIRDLCKVHEADVIKVEEDKLTVEYDGHKRKVLGTLIPKAKVGNKVRIHWGYAVEILK